jgi:hypothetical protein
VNVKSIVKNDWVIISLNGLKKMELTIESREANLYRNKKVPRNPLPYDEWLPGLIKKKEKEAAKIENRIIKKIISDETDMDENKKLQIFSGGLKGYLKDIKELQLGEFKKEIKDENK